MWLYELVPQPTYKLGKASEFSGTRVYQVCASTAARNYQTLCVNIQLRRLVNKLSVLADCPGMIEKEL